LIKRRTKVNHVLPKMQMKGYGREGNHWVAV
jgi:biotin-(acetyl-CoA carboxylase) ligase